MKVLKLSGSEILVGICNKSAPGASLPPSVLLTLPLGSRFEQGSSQVGAAHFCKAASFLSNAYESKLAITREAELRPAPLSATLTRERLLLFATCSQSALASVVNSLAAMAECRNYVEHEFERLRNFVEFEVEQNLLQPLHVAVDSLHHVAFRGGLGNSLFGTKNAARSISKASVETFKQAAIQRRRLRHPISLCFLNADPAQVSRILDHESFLEKVNRLPVVEADAAPEPKERKYFGGELRLSLGNSKVLAVAFPAAHEDSAVAGVAAALLKDTGNVQFSDAELTPWSELKQRAGVSVQTIFESHSDSRLFGYALSFENNVTRSFALEALRTAQRSFASLASSVPKDLLARAKIEAKALRIRTLNDSGRFDALNLLSKELFIGHKITDHESFFSAIDSVSEEHVRQFFASAISQHPSFVAVGNLVELPYADELFVAQ